MDFRRERRLKPKALFDLTPLIDVVLILLFFFMLSSTFTVTASVPIESARISAPLFFEEKDLSVTLLYGEGGPGNGGRILVNEDEISAWEDLSATLAEWHRRAPEASVMIRPDARVPAARLIEVLALANGLGIDRYAIAAQGEVNAAAAVPGSE